MRMKLLRSEDDTTVLLALPETAEEYAQAVEVLGPTRLACRRPRSPTCAPDPDRVMRPMW